MNQLYGNKLNDLINNPGSFSGTPGFQFALDQGLQATQRGMSSQRGSGNALAALMDRGVGMANQNYTDYAKLLGGLTGQEQQYDIGQSQQANAADRNVNDFTLGSWNATNNAENNWWNYDLGRERNAQAAANSQNDFNIRTGGGPRNSNGGSVLAPSTTANWRRY